MFTLVSNSTDPIRRLTQLLTDDTILLSDWDETRCASRRAESDLPQTLFILPLAALMTDRKPQRVIRVLTASEQAALNAARVAADAEKDEILDQARSAKSAWPETLQVADSLVKIVVRPK